MGFIRFKFEDDEHDEPLLGSEQSPDKDERILIEKDFFKAPKDEDSFILDWEKRLGYEGNPFRSDDDLKPYDNFIAGYRRERELLNLFVLESRSFGTISGPIGYGKTMLLNWLEESLSRYSKKIIVVRVDGRTIKEGSDFMVSVLAPFLGPIERHFKKIHQKMNIEGAVAVIRRRLNGRRFVVMVDDFTQISKQNLMFINSLLAEPQARMLIAGEQTRIDRFLTSVNGLDESISGRIRDDLRIILKGLNFEDAKTMIQKRVERYGGISIEPFNSNMIKKLNKMAERSPAILIGLCLEQAMKLSVDPELVRQLKEESEEVNVQIFEGSSYQQKIPKKKGYDSIEIIRHEHKEPIVIRNPDDRIDYMHNKD